MTLASGSRLGPYEIVAPLGAGGMGEVWKARDTRLDRTVAIKVLPDHLSSAEARHRFEREAKTISALSHPHICALYDVGNQDGVEYLVMEYLEGETLAARLVKAPLPLDQTLRYGIEIADALNRAHRQGIVHRDLKPGNVMLTKSGVKLLDFGLAKLAAPTPSVMSGLSMLPTTPKGSNLTQEGTILGTFQYMAPEQLEGKEADARTDIFAFGAVLYEMVTGKKPFIGASQASLIAAILEREPPPVSQFQPMTPPSLDRVVKKCLAKDSEDRWQSASDLKSELEWIRDGSAASAPTTVRARSRTSAVFAWAAAAILLAGLAVFASRDLLRGKPVRRVTRFHVIAPPGEPFSATLALSPDGRWLAFTTSGASPSLFLHSLESGASHPVAGTQEAKYPFWSPDGKAVGFFSQGLLKRVETSGGPPQTLCEAGDARGGAWSRDGQIIFSPSAIAGLYRVSATAGGASAPLTVLDAQRQENSHRWPAFLPDGRRYLFLVMSGGMEARGVYLGTLGSSKRRKILPDQTSAVYSDGYLLFRRQSALLAQRFDLEREEVMGEPAAVAESARGDSAITGLSAFSAAETAVLAYRAGTVEPTSYSWMDRSGKVLSAVPDSQDMIEPSLSPDEKRVAWHRSDQAIGSDDIWVTDFARGTSSRLTFDPSDEVTPIWSPDGTRLAFSSSRGGSYDLYEKDASGGQERLILHTGAAKYLDDWSSDGKYLLYEEVDPKTLVDLWVLPLFGDRKPIQYLRTRFNEAHGQFSPDGKWIAYVSDESARPEIFVQPFPPTGAKWQVSNGGADAPAWRRDGKELFYVSLERKMMAAPVETRGTFESGAPRALFAAPVPTFGVSSDRTPYAVTADGQRFLVRRLLEERMPTPITVVLDWTAGLKK